MLEMNVYHINVYVVMYLQYICTMHVVCSVSHPLPNLLVSVYVRSPPPPPPPPGLNKTKPYAYGLSCIQQYVSCIKDTFSGIGVKHVNFKSLGLFSCREVD